MLISTVILSFNSAKHLGKALDSMLESYATLACEGEVFVVENGSQDGSVEILKAMVLKHPNIIKPIYSSVNLGTTVSRNLALRQCAGEFVLVMDSDAVCNAPALSTLMDTMKRHPTCGLVVPALYYPDGRFQLSTDTFPTLQRKFQRLLSLKKMESQGVGATDQLTQVDYAISAFWLLRKEAIAAAGLLDEKIFYSPEDVDYCLRIWLKGMTILYEPKANAVHDAQELSRGKKMNSFFFRHLSGLMYYFGKHGYMFSLGSLYRRMPQRQLA
jgi:GT2 family glycosyltransferase